MAVNSQYSRSPLEESADFTPQETHMHIELTDDQREAEAELLDDIMVDIGMGIFQKKLLILCGFGWFADNMWLQSIALILPRVQDRFEIEDKFIGILSSSVFVGMMFGALFWGALADVRGRQQAFNLTLLVTTAFGLAASFANHFWVLCLLLFGLGFGVGGNMPVDGALFLEFTPKNHQYLLTFLSIFFSFGAVFASLLAYFILPKFSCEMSHEGVCMEKGWQYMLMMMAGMTLLMLIGRVILFHLEESPKFLVNQNRHEEAAMVLRRIYTINHHTVHSDSFQENIETLKALPKQYRQNSPADSPTRSVTPECQTTGLAQNPESDNEQGYVYQRRQRPGLAGKVSRSVERLKPLFEPEFRRTTIVIWTIWALVAFAYTMFNVFLPKFLQERGMETGTDSLEAVYRDILIYASAGVPGSVIATVMVEGRLGRRYTMVVSTLGTAISIILFAWLSSRAALVGFSALVSILATLNYAVLYSYTPEIFSSDVRGTACGVASALSRLAGIISPLITGVILSLGASIPLYTASIIFLISAVCTCFLPESKGRAAR